MRVIDEQQAIGSSVVGSERRAVVPDPGLSSTLARFDDGEVEADRQPGQSHAVGQHAPVEQAVRGKAKTGPLAMIDRLLTETEAARCPPADFDDHEAGRRTRVDRHEIELMAADMDVPGQDAPTGLEQSDEDQRFGGVT